MPPATGMTGRTGVSGGTGVETPPPVATNTPPAPSKPVAPVAPVTPVPPVATNTPVATVTSAKAKPSDGSLSVKELSSLDTKTLKAGEARRVKLANGQTIWLHWCPPGSFWMDKPSREVRIGRGFWMARHEVSQALWTKVMGSNPSDRRRGQFAGAMSDAPVCNVSRDDCLRFIDALNQDNKTTGFRLPLDAEWEYAAKAGGNVFPQFAARGQRLPPQGSLGANDWGLCDLFGGVQEWCHDDFPMETATLWKRMFSRRPGNLLRGGTDARPGCGRLRAKTTGRSPTFGLRLCFGGW